MLVVGLASSAGAYPLIESGGGTVSYNNGSGVSGTITYLGYTTGTPAGTVATVGTIGVSDVVLMFSVTPSAGAIDQIGVGAVFCDPGPYTGGTPSAQCSNNAPPYLIGRLSTGAGWGPDGTPDTLYVDISGFSGTAGTRIFSFPDGPDGDALPGVEVGQSSDVFFVSYAASDITFDFRTNINFMISPASGAADFTQSITLVPEPGTALLMGLGLGGIAFAGRRRS
jgi:hypothetical protein